MSDGPKTYDFGAIEKKWQDYWARHATFHVPNPGEPGFDETKPKFYVLDMFPYPSAAGLHVGHPEGYTATDIVARYKRMCGYNVLHPMGYDSFGLPAEQYAVETGVHPAITTKRNVDNIRRQIKLLGFSYDWGRELATTDVQYYKWTQWIVRLMFESWFDPRSSGRDERGRPYRGLARPIAELVKELEGGTLLIDEELNLSAAGTGTPAHVKLRNWADLSALEQRTLIDKHRLAYMDEIPVNWCPRLGTVLANEEVTNEGRSDRGSHPVYRRPLKQWMLGITHYADRLESDLEKVDWPESIKLMQRNWVGRSEGAEVVFPLAGKWKRKRDGGWKSLDGKRAEAPAQSGSVIKAYTTRPDTLFGATYMVLAPEHPLVEELSTDRQRRSVREYVKRASGRTELERTSDSKIKTGEFTGSYAINPVDGREIPIWVADYVMMTYGTGAIMAVPAGDTRDFEFAKKFGLPVTAVVDPPLQWLRDQMVKLGLDKEFATATGREELAEGVEQSLRECKDGSIAQLSAQDDPCVEQVITPLYRDHPDLFFEAFTGEGVAVNSPPRPIPGGCDLNGLPTSEAKAKMTAWLEDQGIGRGAVNYKLRDWLFSRQRYWGEPFPILHGPDGEVISVDESELPVCLPEMDDFTPLASDDPASVPEPPLSRAREWEWVDRPGPDGEPRRYRRELNTMPQWAGSCWYYLRYLSPHDGSCFCDPRAEKYWMPVDLYVGGAEHAVLHLLYARFWHKFLYDLGCVSTTEPFGKLFNQGMIRSIAYRDSRGVYLPYEEVEFREDSHSGKAIPTSKTSGEALSESVEKMSKSLKNVVNPDSVISDYGADTFRLYEMYMGPLEASKPWNTRDVPGLHRFLQRLWRLVVDENTGEVCDAVSDAAPDQETLFLLHRTIREVSEDIGALKFNTAIAEMIKLVNHLTPATVRPRAVVEPLVRLVAPFAPHVAEELWQRLRGDAWTDSLAEEAWPEYDPKLAEEEEVEIAIQINGKVRVRMVVRADADEEQMRSLALADKKIAGELASRKIRFIKCVPGRLVNIVAT